MGSCCIWVFARVPYESFILRKTAQARWELLRHLCEANVRRRGRPLSRLQYKLQWYQYCRAVAGNTCRMIDFHWRSRWGNVKGMDALSNQQQYVHVRLVCGARIPELWAVICCIQVPVSGRLCAPSLLSFVPPLRVRGETAGWGVRQADRRQSARQRNLSMSQ